MTDFQVEHDSPVAAWGQVWRDLRQRIERGLLRPGARIATERELAEHYGVSRITLRQALDRLARDGYIDRRHGSGTFVSERVSTIQHDLGLSIPWREHVEEQGHTTKSVLLEPARVEAVPLDLVADMELDAAEVAAAGDWMRLSRAHHVDGYAIGVTHSWVPAHLARQLQDHLEDGSLSAAFEAVGVSPRSVLNVLESATATAAEVAVLDTYVDAPLFVVRTLLRDGQDAIAEVSSTYWLGSRIRFKYGRATS